MPKISLFFLFFLTIKASIESKSKYWLISCQYTGCSFSFNSCLNCLGEDNCKECITDIHQGCSVCANDIFKEDYMEIIDGNKYLICDHLDPVQAQVCHLYCRGQFSKGGQCVRVNNVPVCQCSSQFLTAPTSSTTKQPLTSNEPSYSFNGTLKFSFSIPYGYQKFFLLPNGDLVRGSSNNFVEIWDTQNGFRRKNLTSGHTNPNVFGLLSNGDLVVGYSNNKTLLVWDLSASNGDALKRVIQTNASFQYLTVLKNDDLAIAQKKDNYDIVIRNSQNGMVKKRLVAHEGAVNEIIELPNGNLVSCSFDKTVKEWNLADESVLKSLMLGNHATSMALLNNGDLAVGLFDGTISIWNLENVNLIRNLIGHTDKICYHGCLNVLENGELLSASYDRTLKVWNPFDGNMTSSHRFLVHQLGTLPDGNLIGSSSVEILVWN